MKKILALVLALILVFAVAGCAKGGGTTTPTSAPIKSKNLLKKCLYTLSFNHPD